jgi:hypothetical protein
MKPGGRGIFTPETRMAVHRGDQPDGQGRAGIPSPGSPLAAGALPEPAPFGCPATAVHRGEDNGTRLLLWGRPETKAPGAAGAY